MTKPFICKYCKGGFAKESTLFSHMCESKRRWQQESSSWVQLGLKAYCRFYETTQNGKARSYEEFVKSPYYIAFVKFGRHCQEIRCVNFKNYLDWLLKTNVKIDNWCSEKLYAEWLPDYIKKESYQDALERALNLMQEFEEEKTIGFDDYFRAGQPNMICHAVANGRISPWVIYNCKSGQDFLGNLTESQVTGIIQCINPPFWEKKFSDYDEDVQWVKSVLSTAGL